ncbi:uncharacterized protein LOC136086194 [Hydra vulgaris]|uniref:Uncharacterized protein LOC136086194 n=1 Tax=Hydra vulgaris TaxID=6087 RepID=A0ABM4CRQ6_HYDVU
MQKRDHLFGTIPAVFKAKLFAVPVSLRKRNKLGLYGGFESKSDAILRTRKIPGNAGQVIKELLKENGLDIAKFHLNSSSISTFNETENASNCNSKPRRKKRRLDGAGCKSISIPIEVSNKVLKDKLEQEIEKGKYRIGKLIVPKTFTKTVCENNLVTEEFLVYGRKLSINDIRADMLKNHKAFMRFRTDQEYLDLSRETIVDSLKRIDEFNDDYDNRSVLHLREIFKKFERTRHLMFWHDGSSLSSHGHILMLISVMYDKAIFFNNNEYYKKYGKKSIFKQK